jgi:predicted nuclease with TOPRIM domain
MQQTIRKTPAADATQYALKSDLITQQQIYDKIGQIHQDLIKAFNERCATKEDLLKLATTQQLQAQIAEVYTKMNQLSDNNSQNKFHLFATKADLEQLRTVVDANSRGLYKNEPK